MLSDQLDSYIYTQRLSLDPTTISIKALNSNSNALSLIIKQLTPLFKSISILIKKKKTILKSYQMLPSFQTKALVLFVSGQSF